jgi:PPK2 family polyphosphate:nucleotide phosphotransferase
VILDPVSPPVRLRDDQASSRPPVPRNDELEQKLDDLAGRLRLLQRALGAENRRALLVVFQGRDASGKDGTIRRVFSGLDPTYCTVANFKRPTGSELDHDYLWRVHQVIPSRGTIGVFNRSHYEDVLAARIHRLVPEEVWSRRFDHINDFERMLTDEGTLVRKFFLHVSRDEQRRRLEERLRDPSKNWKFNPADLEERQRWDEYTTAYEEILTRCSTRQAPWYVVPADHNKVRDYLVLEVLVETLEAMNPQFPPADPELLKKLTIV